MKTSTEKQPQKSEQNSNDVESFFKLPAESQEKVLLMLAKTARILYPPKK